MRKFSISLLLICIVSALAFAINPSELEWEAYIGASMQQSSVSGLKNARLSDVEYYGANEGSLYLPLEKNNGSKILFGAVVGGRAYLGDEFCALSELDVSFGGAKTFAVNVNVGGLYYFVDSSVRFGLGAKFGFYDYNINLGNAEVLPGTTPPVILPEGTIYTGDPISYSILGMSLNPVVDFSVRMGDAISFGASVGYQIGFSFSSALTANKVSIDPKTSGAYYDPQSTEIIKIEMDPKVSLNGFTAQIYALYRM